MHDDDMPSGPTSDRGGHSLEPTCTSGTSPPDDAEAEIGRLIEELANMTAELFIEGKLDPAIDNDSKDAA
ncbi:MAG: hypothetical protein ACT4TC_04680 [Myxococcaceae bacterium]